MKRNSIDSLKVSNSLRKETSYIKHTSIYTVCKQSGTIRNHGNMMIKLVLKTEQDGEVRQDSQEGKECLSGDK